MDKKGLTIDVLTLFPEMFRPVTEDSILGRASEKGLIDVRLTNIREFSNDKHNRADDYPFGGGGGMVMMADPIFGAMEHVDAKAKKVVYMSPRGRILDEEKINHYRDYYGECPETVLREENSGAGSKAETVLNDLNSIDTLFVNEDANGILAIMKKTKADPSLSPCQRY